MYMKIYLRTFYERVCVTSFFSFFGLMGKVYQLFTKCKTQHSLVKFACCQILLQKPIQSANTVWISDTKPYKK